MLDEKLIKEFQTIFREEYGFDMNYEDAEKASVWLVSFFDELASSVSEN